MTKGVKDPTLKDSQALLADFPILSRCQGMRGRLGHIIRSSIRVNDSYIKKCYFLWFPKTTNGEICTEAINDGLRTISLLDG